MEADNPNAGDDQLVSDAESSDHNNDSVAYSFKIQLCCSLY